MIGLLIYLRYFKANGAACTLVRSYEERNGSMSAFGANNTEKKFVNEANKRTIRDILTNIHFTKRERRVIRQVVKGNVQLVTTEEGFNVSCVEIGRIEKWDKKQLMSLWQINNKILHALEITTFQEGLEYYGCTGLTNFCQKS
jgi:hypothetical protein